MRRLKGSVAVITGASSGIGRATAEAFAGRGANVVVTARRSEPLQTLAEQCRRHGVEALAVPADVTDAGAMEALARETVERFGHLDVWVNNAAVNLFAPLEEAPPAEWRRVVETNVFGVFHGMRAAIPHFREQGSGVLVNVSSVLGKLGSPYQSAYVASKHAVRALSDCARQELRDLSGVHVTTVLPGPIDTPMFRLAANYTGWQVKPLRPVMDARRVARAIVVAARRPRREVVVGGLQRDVLALGRLAPGFLEWLAARQIEQDHFMESPSPPWRGNVMEPVEDVPPTVSGGWSRMGTRYRPHDDRAVSTNGSRGRLALALIAGAGAAGMAALARARR